MKSFSMTIEILEAVEQYFLVTMFIKHAVQGGSQCKIVLGVHLKEWELSSKQCWVYFKFCTLELLRDHERINLPLDCY